MVRSRPEAVLDAGYDTLRAAGSSGSKALSTLDLAQKVAANEVRLDRIGRLPDDEVIAELVQVRGHRTVDRGDVPDLHAAPARRVAGR